MQWREKALMREKAFDFILSRRGVDRELPYTLEPNPIREEIKLFYSENSTCLRVE